MAAAMLGTLLPRFPFSPNQNGTIAFAQAVGLMIASVSAGPLIDRWGKKPPLLFGFGIMAAALAALSFKPGYPVTALLLLLLGLGGGVVVTATNALASDAAPLNRASILNLLNLFFGLGGMLTPLLSAFHNQQILTLLLAGLAIATLAVQAATPMPLDARPACSPLLRSAKIRLFSLFLFLYVACEAGIWNWLVKYLESTGTNPAKALQILSLGFALGMLTGRLLVSPLLNRVRPVDVTLICSVVMVITTYALLNTRHPELPVFLAGLAMAPVFPTTLGMIGDAFPASTASAMGIAITSGWAGMAVSSKLIGWLAGGGASNLKTALLLIPLFSCAMVPVNLILRRAESSRS